MTASGSTICFGEHNHNYIYPMLPFYANMVFLYQAYKLLVVNKNFLRNDLSKAKPYL